jgi:hypothetical protein
LCTGKQPDLLLLYPFVGDDAEKYTHMKKCVYFMMLGFAGLLSQCQYGPDKRIANNDSADSPNNPGPIIAVSIATLNANPNKYNGKHVRVKGYLQLMFEGNIIFASKEEYDKGIDSNCLSPAPASVPLVVKRQARYLN